MALLEFSAIQEESDVSLVRPPLRFFDAGVVFCQALEWELERWTAGTPQDVLENFRGSA